MKKIKLTESQVGRLLNESPYDKIKSYVYSKNVLKQGKGTLSGSSLASMSDDLYDAIKGVGTDNEKIRLTFSKCKNFHDVKNLFAKFNQRKGENLLDWLDSDIDYDSEWDKDVLRPISNAYDVSTESGHFKDVAEQDATEKLVMDKFPCLTDTPGYTFKRSKSGVLYFDIGSDEYGVRIDGTLHKHDGTKWTTFPEKTKCTGSKYQDVSEQDINEQGLDLNPGGEKQTTTTSDTSTGDTKTVDTTTDAETKTTDTETKTADTENTPDEKPKVVTRLMTGNDVKEIQTILHKQGFGDIVGSVDGKLGKKTLAGIKQLFLGATRPKIEAITSLKPKGIEPLTKTEPNYQLAEEIQKNFNRFL